MTGVRNRFNRAAYDELVREMRDDQRRRAAETRALRDKLCRAEATIEQKAAELSRLRVAIRRALEHGTDRWKDDLQRGLSGPLGPRRPARKGTGAPRPAPSPSERGETRQAVTAWNRDQGGGQDLW